MIQVIQLKGKDKHLYRLLAPMVMDPDVIRANNNYPFRTDDNYVWFIASEDKEILGFIPVEQKSRGKAIINNYYVKPGGERREEVISYLLSALITEFGQDNWLLNSVTLIQDKAAFEKFEFIPMDKKWTRYVKMYR